MHRPRTTATAAFPLALFLVLAGCGTAPKKPSRTVGTDDEPGPAAIALESSDDPKDRTATGTSDGATRAGCIVVQADFAPQPTSVEGVLAKTTGKASAPFVVRLTRPRCIVGLERASVVTEVYVASTGADLRPLVDARLRITGDAIAGTNDLGGPAVILLAKDFERLPPPDAAP